MAATYPPLADVRRRLKVEWYRSPVDRARLRALNERSDARGWCQAGGHFALFLATGAASLAAWHAQAWALMLAALWLHGTVASFFSGTAPHELAHGTVFRTPWLNRAFLYLFSLISWWDPFDYAGSHTYHHRYTQHPRADRENLMPLAPSLHPWLLVQLFTIKLFVPPGRSFGKGGLVWTVWLTTLSASGRHGPRRVPSCAWLAAIHADQPREHRRSILWSRLLLGFHGTLLVVSIAAGLWLLPLLVSCASFIAGAASYFVGMTQHCGLCENSTDFRKNTRSVRLPAPLEFLYWHMNWHTEHHMYAAVPCYHLKALAREIEADMPPPRSLVGAWREMRATWRRQQTDPGYAFDTPLPASEAGATAEARVAAQDIDIGDLAPTDLAARRASRDD